jgi:hypothetical protein
MYICKTMTMIVHFRQRKKRVTRAVGARCMREGWRFISSSSPTILWTSPNGRHNSLTVVVLRPSKPIPSCARRWPLASMLSPALLLLPLLVVVVFLVVVPFPVALPPAPETEADPPGLPLLLPLYFFFSALRLVLLLVP